MTNDHLPVNGLAACKELRLSDRMAAASLFTALAAAHALGFEPGRSFDRLHLVSVTRHR